MKKVKQVLLVLAIQFFVTSVTVFASAPENPSPYTLPFTYNGVTYTKALQVMTLSNDTYPYVAKSIYYNGTETFLSALFKIWVSPTIV